MKGSGFLVVNSKADGGGNILYTRSGSFRKDNQGNYVNSAGYTLMGWPLDGEGRLPGANGNSNNTPNSLLSSLSPVNLRSISGSAVETTTVSLGINLKESQKILQGSGEGINFPTDASANYHISSTDPISPENNGGNILNIGDSLKLTPTDSGTAYNFVYGGVAISKDISTGILGANTAQANFSGATDGQGFTITVGGNTSRYTYQSTNPIASSGQFNSLENLVLAMNQTSGLHARIANDASGTKLLVTPTDANQAMNFADNSGSNFVTSLGLSNTIANASGNRFSSLSGLSKLINSSAGISSTISNPLQNAKLNFFSTNSLSKLKVEAIGTTPSAGTPFSLDGYEASS
ncbi:MAG: hypothetical protein EOP45_15590 [Sphingobacteriaceae bacterium]|nr:MAG: hypothetical protein EOP45_15590 [Sphingobacteriaceae bacterium]